MKRHSYLIVIGTLLIFITLMSLGTAPSAAQKPPRYKITMVLWRGMTEAEKGFIHYLDYHGIADPGDLNIIDCERDVKRLSKIIRNIKKEPPDLLYTFGTTVTTAIAGRYDRIRPEIHITDIPIVFNIVAKPVQARIVRDLAASHRNITGVSHLVPLSSQIKAMQSVLPFNKLGVIYNPMEKNALLQVNELKALTEPFGYELVQSPVQMLRSGTMEANGLKTAVDKLAAEQSELIYLPSDSLMITNSNEVVRRALDHRIPTFSATEEPIRKSGALMGLVSNYYSAGQFAGYKAKQILVQGKSPTRIPIQTLDKFSFVINMQSARELKIYPPIEVFRFAEVINPLPSAPEQGAQSSEKQ